MAMYSQRVLSAVSSAVTSKSKPISGWMLQSLTATATTTDAGSTQAGALKVQVSNAVPPFPGGGANEGGGSGIPEASWVDMPGSGSSVTMAAGASVALQAPPACLGNRWYRLVFTGTGTGTLNVDAAGLAK